MKRVLAMMLTAALCALAFVPHDTRGQGRGQGKLHRVQGAIPNRYIVVLRGDVQRGSVAAVADSLAGAHGGRVGFVYEYALKGFSVELPEAAAIALSLNPLVEYVEEDGVGSIVDTPQSNPPWGLDRIDQRSLPLTNSYIYSHNGAGVHAYVIDTGILATHVDFGGRASMAADFVGEACADCNGHGTHVAGTVGGATYGVAKGVSIRAVKVCNVGGFCGTSATIAGVNFVTQQKQNNPSVPAVANMSLRFPPTLSLDDAVRNSLNAEVTYAIAAGNDADFAANYSPARVTQALTVGATDINDTRPVFSNYGSVVDLFAPGVDVPSAWNTGNTATAVLTGTSMATPHVAGVAALYLQQNPSASPPTVNQALVAHATSGKVINPQGSPNLLLYSLFKSERDNRADFDRDYRTDVSVWNQSNGVWSSRNSSDGQPVSFGFGLSGDIITPGDYNGDGRTDRAVFRPSDGTWYIATDTSGSFYGVPFGQSGDIPVARDYDGDGMTDVAVFRPSDGTWYVRRLDGSFYGVQFGVSTDRLVPGDYDGDGRANIAVFRPSNGTWYVRRLDGSFYGVQFGVSTDLPVQADYDGDDLTDIAVFRPNGGEWWILSSSTNTAQMTPWGLSSDVPVPGDYDGDGKADVAVQRPGGTNTWYVLNSSTNTFSVVNFSAGFPVPAGYLN